MPTDNTYEDSFRAHDVAVLTWLLGLRVDYGLVPGESRPNEPILTIMAAPHQAFAQLPDLLVERGWVAGIDDDERRANAEQYAVHALPLVTVERRDPQQSTELSGVPKRERHIYYNPDTGMWEIHPWPGAWMATYDITVWSLKKYTDNYVREWIMGQLGQLGRTEYETMLSVQHREPWGTMFQSFKLTGTSDLSELEGESQRYIRTQFSFDMRMWVLKKPIVSADPVGIAGAIWCSNTGDVETHPAGSLTLNYFQVPYRHDDIPAYWPLEGSAAVEWSDIAVGKRLPGLVITVPDENSAVPIADAPISADEYGVSFIDIALSYSYQGDEGDAHLEVITIPATGAPQLLYDLALPFSKTRKTVHVQVPASGGLARVSIVGVVGGPTAVIGVAEIAVRQLLFARLDKFSPTTTLDLGTAVQYVWGSLDPGAYCIAALLAPTLGGAGLVTVENDATAPDYSRTQSVAETENIGFALLIQPKTSTIRATVPKTLRLSTIYAAPYPGHYHGHDL